MKVGDKVSRRMEGFGYDFRDFPGEVIKIDKEIITCSIETSNRARTMIFDAKTGVNVNGVDFGWLVEIVGQGLPKENE